MALLLRDYQEQALQRSAAAEARGVRAQLGVAATGLGKALAASELALTPTGWRCMGQLRVGDQVIGADGKPTDVVGVYPQGDRPAWKVTFSDGPVVTCDADHLWSVRTKHDRYRVRPWRLFTTAELGERGLVDPAGGRRWEVPIPLPAQMPEADLPLDPYLLGLLLGDGGLSVPGRVLVHTEDALVATVKLPAPATWKRMHDLGGGAGTWIIGGPTGCSPNPVLSAVRALKLEGRKATEKAVPVAYLHAPEAARLAVLQGILDADGHARPDGHVEATFANYQLAQDVANLVRSLAGTARIAKRPTVWTHRGTERVGVAWRVSIAMATCPFRWRRKADVWRPRTKYQPRRSIVGIQQRGVDEMVCIKVANPDGLFVTRGYVVTHNTIIFAEKAKRTPGRTLVLVHRDELAQQAVAKLLQVWPDARVGLVKAERNEVHADVVVASVQTLGRPARLAQLMAPWTDPGLLSAAEPFALVVVDEAHHVQADNTYGTILAALRAGEPERDATPTEVDAGCELGVMPAGPLLFGVTATPDRGDGLGLDKVFGEVVFSYDTLYGIRAGYLADVRGRRVKVQHLDLAAVKVSHGDVDQGQAGAAMEAAHAQDQIVKAWHKEAAGRRTLVFTPTIEVARLVAEAFTRSGVPAAYVHGGTPQDERRALLGPAGLFASGDVQVVANCAVLTEGYDEPRVDCVVVARPTRSRALYAQMVGRGLRKHPEKVDCLVLDVVGATDEHSLITIPSLFGLEKGHAKAMADGTGLLTDVVQHRDDQLVQLGRMTAEDADLFRAMRAEGIAWVQAHKTGDQLRRYVRPLGRQVDGSYPTVVLAQRTPTTWTAGLWHPATPNTPERKGVLIAEVDLELAQGVAEQYARTHAPDTITRADAEWRKGKPTRKQLQVAKAWHLKVDKSWNAGQLSEQIDAHIARIKARPKRAKPRR